MMKTLIIYLSLTGNTKRLANEIADKLEDSELLPITLKTKIPKSKFWTTFKFGFLMTMNKGFKYSIPSVDLDRYDQVVIGTPVWMGRAAPPVISVINKLKISDEIMSAFVTCGGDPGKVFNDICERSTIKVITNRLTISDLDNYNDLKVQDRIESFVNGIKSSFFARIQAIEDER